MFLENVSYFKSITQSLNRVSLLPACLSVYLSVHPCRIERFWKMFWIWKDFGVLVGCFAQKLPIINLCDTERSHFTCSLVNHQISVWGNQAKLRHFIHFLILSDPDEHFWLLNAISILKPKFRRVETDACFSFWLSWAAERGLQIVDKLKAMSWWVEIPLISN